MNFDAKPVLSNTLLRRMQSWARTVYSRDWQDRCYVVSEYVAQLEEATAEALIKKGWPDVFEAAERDWPEAFDGWKQESPDHP